MHRSLKSETREVSRARPAPDLKEQTVETANEKRQGQNDQSPVISFRGGRLRCSGPVGVSSDLGLLPTGVGRPASLERLRENAESSNVVVVGEQVSMGIQMAA